ncbi:MAG TPA: cytochrome c biogenesis protein CcsA [bacterium]|nr:cytochrome c biogenesis protein CcsA [bacterium]
MTLFNGLSGTIALLCGFGCWHSFRYYKNLDDLSDKLAIRWLTAGFLVEGIALGSRWITEGAAPLTTLDGIFLTLSFSLAAALLTGRLKTPVAVLTSLFLPFIFFLSLVAFGASLGEKPIMDIRLMTPGLASHIFLTFLGFSYFTMGFGVAVAFWVQEGQLKHHQLKSWSYHLPALEILDNLTVFYIALGFLFWLGGFALGSVQAFQVWNRLPYSDPKILGSFLVLVIYAVFFLLRWGLRMRGKKSMTLVMAGYFLALFTFVGVRVFMTTQHNF